MKKLGILLVIILVLALGYIFMNNNAAPQNQVSGVATQKVAPSTPEALALVGKWQSTDDEKFTREFKADGSITDMYEGASDATIDGIWYQITDVSKESIELPAVGGATFIKILFNDNVALYFTVSGISETEMSLTYLDRGGVLKFKRVK